MIVAEKEYKKMYKEFDGITFTPTYNLTVEETEVNGIQEKVFKYEILKTAEEVYQYYLNNKNNLPKPQPTKEEIMRAKLLKDNADIQLKLTEQQKFNADLLLKIAKLGGSTNV
ncbi:hypothetical protein ACTFJW_04845 [Clostridium cagae]|uniref:hypothetical protein n=1 Tax=Clostridium cagae TaxID=2080751 RepID=UPI003F75B7F6